MRFSRPSVRLLLLVLFASGLLLFVAYKFKPKADPYGEMSETAKAEMGDALSQTSLGFKYLYGEGVPKDAAEAMKWFRKAAEQGTQSKGINGFANLMMTTPKQ